MNIPFVENRREADINYEEDENETKTESKEDKQESIEKEDEVIKAENAMNDSVVTKGVFSVITLEADNKMTKEVAKTTEVRKIKQFYAPAEEEVVIVKAEDDKKLEYVRLVKLVELCLFVSLAIIFFSFICMICLFLL